MIESLPPKVLVIRCGAVGDTVLATTVIEPIRHRWPDAAIEWLATPAAASLFGADSRITQVHILHHRKLPIWLTPIKRRLIAQAQHHPYTLLLNLETAPYFQSFARQIASQQQIGYGAHHPWRDIHGVENHRSLLAAAGWALEGATPSLRGAPLLLTLPDRFVVLHPGNSHSHSHQLNIRAWPRHYWPPLIAALQAAGVAVVVSGSRSEAPLAAEIVANTTALNLAGQTDLPMLITLLERAELLICSDSGPVHLAAAVGTPIIGLYGPTRPSQTAPYGPPDQIRLLHHPLPCSPCYGTPRQKSCRDNRCMAAITPTEVAAAALARLT